MLKAKSMLKLNIVKESYWRSRK